MWWSRSGHVTSGDEPFRDDLISGGAGMWPGFFSEIQLRFFSSDCSAGIRTQVIDKMERIDNPRVENVHLACRNQRDT